jgi:hypothetical protein
MRSMRFKISLILLILLSASVWLYFRLFAGTVQQRVASPDGSVVAEIRIYNFAGATDASTSTVQLRNTLNPFRHIVFSRLDYGGDVKLLWTGPKRLLVECASCQNLRIVQQEEKWKDIDVVYSMH